MSSPMLRLDHDNSLVNGDGETVVLKGVGLGGWMNMENFITGYPSREFQIREELLRVLGRKKYDIFFESFLTNFFTDKDAKFLNNYGLNALRIPFNYSHFLHDTKQLYPFKLNYEGFKHLDRVVELCAAHGIYTIFDLHAVPGGQNTDWHSDSPGHHAAFWDLLDYQNWVVDLWKVIASRYKNQAWVAGYNPLNEPTAKTGSKLLHFYDRVVKAIHEVDPDHLIFLDGNTFGSDFSFLSNDKTYLWKSWSGVVYSVHDYCKYGFPGLRYQSTAENRAYLERSLERKCTFMRENNLPIWNGEFGPVYDSTGPEKEATNSERYQMLKDQLSLYKAKKIVGWSIWTYKDIGFQGLTYLDPKSPYMTLLAPFLAKKQYLALDAWGASDTHLAPLFSQIEKFFKDNIPEDDQKRYPWPVWKFEQFISRVVRNELLSEFLVPEWARYFEGLSETQLEELGKSFAFENCRLRDELNNILKNDSIA